VERRIQRQISTGELWFAGRRGEKVVWRRLRTHDLRVARATVAMFESTQNGNSAIYLVVDGKEQPLANDGPVAPATPDLPLPRVREALIPVERPAPSPGAPPPASTPAPAPPQASGQAATTLDEFLVRWRGGKAGLKRGTEAKLDNHLKMLRRYVDTSRRVADYKPQDIRDYLAKARADKDESDRRRLKGQTINEAIWRPLRDAFDLALEENLVQRSPMDSVKREKSEPIVRTQHKMADAERILDDVKARSHESYIELAFMLFMGVGKAEAQDFAGGSVDWQDRKINFIRRKTGKPFHVPIYPWAENFIRDEIEPRLKLGQPVFNWRNPRKALDTACDKLGFARVTIVSLRRTLIIHLIQSRVDIRLIAKWQGHADAHLILKRYGAYIDADYERDALAALKSARP
jgi:integrase